mgnify:CR=1 FL=1
MCGKKKTETEVLTNEKENEALENENKTLLKVIENQNQLTDGHQTQQNHNHF